MPTTLQTPAPSFDDVWRTIQELALLSKETDRLMKERAQETERLMKESAQETDRRMQETDRRMQETDRQMRETGKKLEMLGVQIGGLGDKFGYFTEGMALPSMERILDQQFGMDHVMPRARARKGGRSMEIDVLAWANGDVDRVVLVEVKSRVKREAIEQTKQMLQDFPLFYPEHSGKMRTGILAGIDWDRGVHEEALAAGLLTAAIHDEVFDLTAPPGFEPKDWSGK